MVSKRKRAQFGPGEHKRLEPFQSSVCSFAPLSITGFRLYDVLWSWHMELEPRPVLYLDGPQRILRSNLCLEASSVRLRSGTYRTWETYWRLASLAALIRLWFLRSCGPRLRFGTWNHCCFADGLRKRHKGLLWPGLVMAPCFRTVLSSKSSNTCGCAVFSGGA